jgi:hypothetical protein
MAVLNAIMSFRIRDADNEDVSMPIYLQVDDATSVADLATAMGAFGNDLDPVIDGQIVRLRVSIDIPVNPAWKGAPVSGAEIERVGAFNYTLSTPVGKTFTIDVPTFAYADFVGNRIDQAITAVATFITRVTGFPATQPLDDKWNGQLVDLLSARKAFRKHRQQTKRK